MDSITPIRRPLATRDSNVAPTPRATSKQIQKVTSHSKSVSLVEALPQSTRNGETTVEAGEKTSLDSNKRNNSNDYHDLWSNKRRKMEVASQAEVPEHDLSLSGEVACTLAQVEMSSSHAEIGLDFQNQDVSLDSCQQIN